MTWAKIRMLLGMGEKAMPYTPPIPPAFFPWKSITVGIHKNADEYVESLRQAGCEISRQALEVLQGQTFLQTPARVQLALCTPQGLGCRSETVVSHIPFKYRYREILAKARSHGLMPCSGDIGPQLCIEYQDQPLGERLIITAGLPAVDDHLPAMFEIVTHDETGVARELDIRKPQPSFFMEGEPLVFMIT